MPTNPSLPMMPTSWMPQVLSDSDPVKWFDAERGFPALGRTILLAIEDDSDRSRAEAAMKEGG